MHDRARRGHVGIVSMLLATAMLCCALGAAPAAAAGVSGVMGPPTALESPVLTFTPEEPAIRLIDAASDTQAGAYESPWGAPMYPVVSRSGDGEWLNMVDSAGSAAAHGEQAHVNVNRIDLVTGLIDREFHGQCSVAEDGETGFNGRVLPDAEEGLTFVSCNGDMGVYDDAVPGEWSPTECTDDVALLLDIDPEHTTVYYTTSFRDVRTYSYATNATDGVFFVPHFDIDALAVVSPSHLFLIESGRLIECVAAAGSGVWTFTVVNDAVPFDHVSYDGTQGLYVSAANNLFTCDLFACNATLALIRTVPVTMTSAPIADLHFTFAYDATSQEVYWSELNTGHAFTDVAVVKKLELLHEGDKGYIVTTLLQSVFPLDVAGTAVKANKPGVVASTTTYTMDIYFITYGLVGLIEVRDAYFGAAVAPLPITRALAEPELLAYDAAGMKVYVYADDNIYVMAPAAFSEPTDVVHGVNIDAMTVGNGNVFTVGASDAGATHVAVRRYPTSDYEHVLLTTIPSPGLADMPAAAMLYDGAGDRLYVAVPQLEHSSALYFVDNAQYCVLGCVSNELQPAARVVRPLALSADVFRVYVPSLALEERAVSLVAFDYADGANAAWIDVLPGNEFVAPGFSTGFVAQDGYGYYVAGDATGVQDGPGVYRMALTNATDVARVVPLDASVLQLKTSLVRANSATVRRVAYADATGRVVLYNSATGTADTHTLGVPVYELAVDTRDDNSLLLFITESAAATRILRCDLGAGGACMPFIDGGSEFRFNMLWAEPNLGGLYVATTYPEPALWMAPDNSTQLQPVTPAHEPLGQLMGVDVEGGRVTFAAGNGQNAVAQEVPGSPVHTMVTGFSMPAGMFMIPSTPEGGLPDTTTQLAWLSVDASTPPVCASCPLYTTKLQTLSEHDDGSLVPDDMLVNAHTTVLLRALPTPGVTPTPSPEPSPSPSPTSSPVPSPSPSPHTKGGKKGDALVVGLAVGGSLLAVGALAAGYVIMRRRRTHSINNSERSLDEYHLI